MNNGKLKEISDKFYEKKSKSNKREKMHTVDNKPYCSCASKS